MTERIERVGLLGWPVGHSISPAMHNAAFEALGLRWRYEPLPTSPDELMQRLGDLVEQGYRGFNVTVPHKRTVLDSPHITQIDPVAAEIGAVNTLAALPGGGLRASNTDWRGFADDLAAHEIQVRGAVCIVLGTGGSSKAVTYALRHGAAAEIVMVSRSPDGAKSTIGYHQLAEAIAGRERLIVVNCTPVGMNPDMNGSPWPDGLSFPKHAVLVDLVYNPRRTRLMGQALDAGAQAIGGLGMLVRQGALAFEAWTGVRPPIEVMAQVARRALGLERRGSAAYETRPAESRGNAFD